MREHLENNIEVITVIFHFGPLVRVQDVFLYKGVEAVTFPELPDDLGLMDSVYINPRHRWFLFEGKTRLNRLCIHLMEGRLVVVKDGDPHSVRLPVPDVHERSRREAGFLRSFLHIPRHVSSPYNATRNSSS